MTLEEKIELFEVLSPNERAIFHDELINLINIYSEQGIELIRKAKEKGIL